MATPDGYLFLDREKFAEAFAADLPADDARFLADSQAPWGPDALAGTVVNPAWRDKPSFYLVAGDDRVIPPPATACTCPSPPMSRPSSPRPPREPPPEL
ncbi:hypothetical protein [Streptomyces goshikiensis]|uniref:hypothetical protein n=1 Tax=Streptomyces goshikiensis TaxID=1942 RepID=UPI0036813729